MREKYYPLVWYTLIQITLTRLSRNPEIDKLHRLFTGNSSMQEKVITSSSKLYVAEVTNLVSGSLKLTVSCTGPYTLQVTGSSPIDFTYQLLDVEDMERGTTRRVVGNPLRGKVISRQRSL